MAEFTYHSARLVLTEHEFDVPLDHAAPDGERITVFAREVADPDGARAAVPRLPAGWPRLRGVEADPPAVPTGVAGPGAERVPVLMLDQRGTGRSSPVDASASAERLKHFRADSIVRDAEWIRRELGVERWSILGQSFGGFCALTYLSLAPEGLREAFFTGGLPPVGRPIDDVYEATYERTAERCRRYYER